MLEEGNSPVREITRSMTEVGRTIRPSPTDAERLDWDRGQRELGAGGRAEARRVPGGESSGARSVIACGLVP